MGGLTGARRIRLIKGSAQYVAHGPIRVREVGGGIVRLANGHADIDVGVPTDRHRGLDRCQLSSRRVRNELTPDPAAAASARSVELHLHANYGNVIIRRIITTPGREASK